jgi:D-amino peptidase
MYRNIYVISDIEGSSLCFDYDSSRFMTPGWPGACLGMTRDVDLLCRKLFDAGVENVIVKDFHRTGYNIFSGMVDRRARVVHGYRRGPVPGFGYTGKSEAAMMVGMHASSGSGGFLAHTFTSRIGELRANGKRVSEAQLFSSVLYPQGIVPLFFSACPVGCREVEETIPGMKTFAIDKSVGRETFNSESWRGKMTDIAVESLYNNDVRPWTLEGPMDIEVRMRDGEDAAHTMAEKWGLDREGSTLFFRAGDARELFFMLTRICFLTPMTERFLPLALGIFNIMGRMGQAWAWKRAGRYINEKH